MQLYNSLTRKKENFTPLNEGVVNMYVCGITAYDYCHIGHARSALVFDVMVRYMQSKGLDVNFIRNFTDVDDKIINRANKENRDWREVANTYIDAFHEDMDRLGVLRATNEPRATNYIQEMQDLCSHLIAEDKAYSTPCGDVYFRVRAYPPYGKLSGRTLDELQAGARVAPGEEKQDPLDFALWKSAKPGEPFWESPWGKGRPGWHIECSAMNSPFLPLDIHGGGLDLIFPHHENEIAQSEAATGKELAKFWVHNGFVQVDSEKMSKSLGNFKTIRDILQSYLPETLRFFLLSKHYRSPIDFTGDSMIEAEKAQKRVYEAMLDAAKAAERSSWKKTALPAALVEEFDSLAHSFDAAMDDDFNSASAIGHIFALVRLINRLLEDKGTRAAEQTRDLLARFTTLMAQWSAVLGVFGQDPATFLNTLRAQQAQRIGLDTDKVASLMQARLDARKAKDFALSDALRDELASMGVAIRDTPEGTVWDIA